MNFWFVYIQWVYEGDLKSLTEGVLHLSVFVVV